ncbi:unnamed protein product [Leptosia nina]|uniref:TELO2-interacting protein 1 homolog n=1 Tax=Leptosia nina TaxID=320188 RepID=A0AAV1IVU0_9NEOP
MNAELKAAFTLIKPVCDMIMVSPTVDLIKEYTLLTHELKKESLQELQQYMLFPIITHLQPNKIEGKYEMQRLLVNAMKEVLDSVSVSCYEMCIRIELTLAKMALDKKRPGMIADISEELKLSAMQCMTALMLNLETSLRLKMIKSHAPLLAQAVFVSVHMAKLEKLRVLKLAALDSVLAHTCTHPKLTDANCMISNPVLEDVVVRMLGCILPGLVSTLQDVAMCSNNPGHAVVVMALNATHRILCMTMNDKHLTNKEITIADFIKAIEQKDSPKYVRKGKTSDLPKLTKEWFDMAGEKLEIVVRSLVRLGAHEHFKVRKELAVLCYRILSECNNSMLPSIPMCLDILITLSGDPYSQVSSYCTWARSEYLSKASPEMVLNAMDGLTRNLFMVLGSLPRVLNNIDSSRKLSSLNLLEGYVQELYAGEPQRLTIILSSSQGYSKLCDSLVSASAIESDLALLNTDAIRDVTAAPPRTSPWCKFRHLDSSDCVKKFENICRLLGEAECGQLILDTLLETFAERRDIELVYLMNRIASAPKSTPSLAKRVIDTYIEEDVWYLPLKVGNNEPPLTDEDTLDETIYNPRAWSKDSVPGLFEGAMEVRYTDISYQTPRVRHSEPNSCRTLRQAQRNIVQCCLLTEGLGLMAKRLQGEFQPYLLKTLCMVLERVGSRYEMLHLSGLKAINDIKIACGHNTVAGLIASNADYFTNEITRRLKKAWNAQSALEILTVVMEFSDDTILEYMYGVVEDMLVRSCDKYYKKSLYLYLQVFRTFLSCIYKWFPEFTHRPVKPPDTEIDVLSDVMEYIKSEREADMLMGTSEEDAKTVEEMYADDLKRKEDDVLDYDDTVTNETPPLPKHIEVTIMILKRCINFISTEKMDDAIMTLEILNLGFPLLRDFENELLPLVHLCWAPLVTRFEDSNTTIVKGAIDLVVTLATLSKEFIMHRTVKEVLPQIYSRLQKLAAMSRLKDAGSSYRFSPRYKFQLSALTALAPLAVELSLPETALEEAMDCAQPYLSNKQPKPLQALSVQFFKAVLQYNYGAAWLHLRRFCNNSENLEPPKNEFIQLATITGTPYSADSKEFDNNIKTIFDVQ